MAIEGTVASLLLGLAPLLFGLGTAKPGPIVAGLPLFVGTLAAFAHLTQVDDLSQCQALRDDFDSGVTIPVA